MSRYLLRRLAELVLVFLGVTLLIYLMVFALPGDPIQALGGDRPLPANVVAQLRERYHLDEPVLQQYARYLGGLVQGDLGTNFQGQSVGERMSLRWPVTVTLALTAWGIEVVLGVLLGLLAGLRRGRTADRLVLAGTILATSIPVFVVAVSAQLLFGVRLGWFPVAGTTAGWPTSYLLPALVKIGWLPFLTTEQSQMLVFVLVGVALMLLVIFRPQGILGSKKELTFVR